MLFLQKPCQKETREGPSLSRVGYFLCHCEAHSNVAIPPTNYRVIARSEATWQSPPSFLVIARSEATWQSPKRLHRTLGPRF